MARQARRAANLVPGASLRGLVFDACYDNRIPHTFGMLRHFGMPNRNRVLVSESPHLNTAGLAAALRIDEAELLSRRYPPVGRGHRDFHGIQVMKGRIEDRIRRFSPSAIAKGILHHPATHELRDLPFSTVGWDMLQETCPCEMGGVRQNWITTNGSSRCHACGGSLGRIQPVPVADELRRALSLLAGLVDPVPDGQRSAAEMLPPAVREADRTLLHDLIMNLARATTPVVDDADPVTRTAALARACEALLAWPDGFDRIQRADDCPTHVWDWVRRTYAILDGARKGASSRTGVAAPASAGPALRRYVASGSKGRISTPFISAMAAARLGGIDEQALKQAWDDGRFTQHIWVLGPSRVRAFNPVEVVRTAPLLRVVGSRTKAANALGIPLYGLEQLLEARLFTPATPGAGMKQLRAHLDEAAALTGRIEEARIAAVRDPVALVDAIRHVSGRPKPWAAVISALLDGSLACASDPDREGSAVMSRLVIERGDIPSIATMPHDLPTVVRIERANRWSGVDALECLNGNRSAAELLDGIESVEIGRRRLLPVGPVVERAAAGVTTYDLTRRSGIGTTRIAARLEQNGVRQLAPGLWERTRAEELTLRPGSW